MRRLDSDLLPMAAMGLQAEMLGSTSEPVSLSVPRRQSPSVTASRHSSPLATPPPVPGHAGVSPPPISVTAPSLPRAHAPVVTAEGGKRRPPNAPPKKRLRSPLVSLVGSPGINLMLSRSSPRSIGVKRPSPVPPANLCFSRRSKRRKLKSEIWNDFDPEYNGNKLKEATCKHCKKVFVATRESGTSHCLRHLLVCEEKAKVSDFLDSMKAMDPNKAENWKYDPEKAHWDLVRMIVRQYS